MEAEEEEEDAKIGGITNSATILNSTRKTVCYKH
jgi:hypothetical protein